MSLARPLGWIGVVAGLLAQLAAYVVAIVDRPDAPPVAWLAMIGITASMSGTLVIGALRHDRLSRPATIAALALFLMLVIPFGAAILMPADTAATGLWLGLPRRASLVLLGVGVLPLLVLPFAYASDTNNAPLDAAGLAELRAEAARLRSQGPG